jgi:cysteine desulfurase
MNNSKKVKGKRVFLDYASITPIDKNVEGEMLKIQKLFWGNPSSLHKEGEDAKNVLEKARLKCASILQCRGAEIIFTSGGSESLNLAIFGTVKPYKNDRGETPHIIVSTIEHPAILEPIKYLIKNKEAEASFVSPDADGKVDPESIKKEIKSNTVLVVVQHANNEIGIVEPIQKIANIVKAHRSKNNSAYPYFLVDASQSFLYEKVSLERLQADLLVLDGIKIYGPRGAGILVARRGLNISPIIFGGGQEGGLRAGTENVAGAVGLSKALEIGESMREREQTRLKKLRDYAISKILKEFPNASLNGGGEERLPNNINICFEGEDSEFLVIKLDTLGFAASAASACNTLKLDGGSYVVESLGRPECATSSLRITLGRETKKSDLNQLITALKKIIKSNKA